MRADEFVCYCEAPINVWRVGAPAHCSLGCSDGNVDACGGPERATSVRSVFLGRQSAASEECVCLCKEPFVGAACDQLQLKGLPMPPVAAIVLGLVLTAALGGVVQHTVRGAQPPPFNKLMSMEALDSLLDAVTFGITWFQDGFHFANDPLFLYAWTIGLVAVGSAVFFVLEFVAGDFLFDRSFIVIHMLCEDGLQLMLYTIASLSSFQGDAGLPMGIVLGILQGLIFFLTKLKELNEPSYDRMDPDAPQIDRFAALRRDHGEERGIKEAAARREREQAEERRRLEEAAAASIREREQAEQQRRQEEAKREAAQKAAKPSDQAIQRLLKKVGGTLDGALKATSLEWDCKSLDEADMVTVAYIVRVSASLTGLDLDGNEIGDTGAAAIAKALAVNASVTVLRCARFLTKPF